MKIVGIGEFTASASPIIAEASEVWRNGTRRVAEAGWRNENHSLTPADFKIIIDEWERLNAALPAPGIRDQRWVVAHAPFITQEYVDKLKALGGGVSVLGGWRYISGTAQQNGPPFKMLADSGIPIGMSSDGMQISPMNPWLGLYYVVTGKNARGEVINAGQTLRAAALRLYTAANGWFLGEEGQLGTIEPGKYADLAVLSADYFDASAVQRRGDQAHHFRVDGRRRPDRLRQSRPARAVASPRTRAVSRPSRTSSRRTRRCRSRARTLRRLDSRCSARRSRTAPRTTSSRAPRRTRTIARGSALSFSNSTMYCAASGTAVQRIVSAPGSMTDSSTGETIVASPGNSCDNVAEPTKRWPFVAVPKYR